MTRPPAAPAPTAAAHHGHGGLHQDHFITIGLPLATIVFPAINSILDTIYWCDGYKSLSHVFFLSVLWLRDLCGVRFMAVLLWFHVLVAVAAASRRRRTAGVATVEAERRRALRAFRLTAIFLAQQIEAMPSLFFVVPPEIKSRTRFHCIVAAVTALFALVLFQEEISGALGTAWVLPGVVALADFFTAPLTVVVIIAGGLRLIHDPRYSRGSPKDVGAAAPPARPPTLSFPTPPESPRCTSGQSSHVTSFAEGDADAPAKGTPGSRAVARLLADSAAASALIDTAVPKSAEAVQTVALSMTCGSSVYWMKPTPDAPWDLHGRCPTLKPVRCERNRNPLPATK